MPVTCIVQVANFVGPASGGIRTTLDALGRGYLAAGHERVVVLPGAVDGEATTASGRQVTLRAPRVPHRRGRAPMARSEVGGAGGTRLTARAGSLYHALPTDLRALALGTEWFIGRALVGSGAHAAEQDLLDGVREPC